MWHGERDVFVTFPAELVVRLVILLSGGSSVGRLAEMKKNGGSAEKAVI